MNLYLIHQNANDNWDTFDSAVVVAETADDAKLTHPRGTTVFNGDIWIDKFGFDDGSDWCHPDFVEVVYIGTASKDMKKNSVICSSFNAG